MKIAYIAGLLLYLSSLATEASNWIELASTSNGMMYWDESSVSKRGALKKAWFREDLKMASKLEFSPYKEYLSYKSLSYFNCSDRTMAAAQIIYYAGVSGAGEPITTINIPFDKIEFRDVAPDSVGEIMLTYVCLHK